MKLGARMPFCVGLYENKNQQCDGESKGKTENERAACTYRDRCLALKEICAAKKRDVDQYVTLRVVGTQTFAYALSEELLPLVQARIHDYRINGGIAVARRRNRPLAVVAPKPTKQETSVNARQMAYWLFCRFAKKASKVIYDGACPHGGLFVVDRTKTSGYKSLYKKMKKGRRSLLSVYPKPSKNNAEVRIGCDYKAFCEALSERELKLLKPIDFTGKDGAFNIRVIDVDKQKASIIADRFAAMLSPQV